MIVFRLSVGIGFCGYILLLLEFTGAGLLLRPLLGPAAALIGAPLLRCGAAGWKLRVCAVLLFNSLCAAAAAAASPSKPAAGPGAGFRPPPATLSQPLLTAPVHLFPCLCSRVVRPVLWDSHPRLR